MGTGKIFKLAVVLCCVIMAGVQGCKTTTTETEPPVAVLSANDATKLYLQGIKLSAEQVAALEKQLNGSSADEKIIAELIGYYAGKSVGNKELRAKRQEHVFWLIRNYPRSGIFHYSNARLDADFDDVETGKTLWTEQLEKNPDDPVILWNVAGSMFACNKKLTEECLLKGEALEPKNPQWSSQLGHFYSLNKAPEKSFAKYKVAYDKQPEANRRVELPHLAKMAFECGQYVEADRYAKNMLQIAAGDAKKQWDTGNLIFHGNYTLGRIALTQGNVADAEKYLLAAGKTPGSPQLNSFGPGLLLASKLFDAGKKETVIEFLTSVSKFWKKDLCEKAIAQIRQGENPFKHDPAKYDEFSFNATR